MPTTVLQPERLLLGRDHSRDEKLLHVFVVASGFVLDLRERVRSRKGILGDVHGGKSVRMDHENVSSPVLHLVANRHLVLQGQGQATSFGRMQRKDTIPYMGLIRARVRCRGNFEGKGNGTTSVFGVFAFLFIYRFRTHAHKFQQTADAHVQNT